MQQTPPAELPPQAPLTPEQMRDFMGPYPKLASGNGTIKVSSPPQTLDGMMQAIQHFNPKSGLKAPPKFGQLTGFKPMRIPVVFHCEYLGCGSSVLSRLCRTAPCHFSCVSLPTRKHRAM
jgi:hypothetical protein